MSDQLRVTQLTREIKVRIVKGEQAQSKANDHFIAAGLLIKELKEFHGGKTAEWEALLKDKCGIGKSRAYELMKIADGRTTVEEVRAEKAESVRKVRAAAIPLRSGKTGELTAIAQAPSIDQLQCCWDAAPAEVRQAFVEANVIELKDRIAQLRRQTVTAVVDRAVEQIPAPIAGDPGELPEFLRRVQ